MKTKLLGLFVAVLITGFMHAQKVAPNTSDNKTKAIFIFGFTKYFEWPAELKKGEFKIGVVGASNELVEELRKIANAKRVDDQVIIIMPFEPSNEAKRFTETHILLYDASVIKGLKIGDVSKNTLVISDNQTDNKNSMIAFVNKDDKVKFIYNKKNLKNSNVKAKADFEKLALEIIE